MNVSDIKALATLEQRLANERDKVDVKYRTAWWRTSIALSKVRAGEDRAVAIRVVMTVTHQSNSWIHERAKLAKYIAPDIPRTTVYKLPPKLTAEVVRAQLPIDKAMVKRLLKADQEGTNLRDFARELTGKSWPDTPAGASRETITKMVQAQPELVGEVVASHPKASQAHDREVLASHNRGQAATPTRHDPNEGVLLELTKAVMRLRHVYDGGNGELSDNAKRTIDWAVTELTAIQEGRAFVGDVEAWLESSTT